MRISPETGEPKRYSISAYDLEWDPDKLAKGEECVTWCGCYDERGYQGFSGIIHFLQWVLTPSNHGRRFYAHFGGASDMVFLLRPFLKQRKYQVRAIFSGSSAIFVRVEKGPLHWDFIDSFWLLRTKLATIGEWRGLPKLTLDFRNFTEAEMRLYNERDCRILWEAVTDFQETILDRGGELGITAASTALKVFLRAYLKKPIYTDSQWLDVQDFARGGYVAGRVEKIRDECEHANYFDKNSSFPHSMTGPIPGKVIGRRKKLYEEGVALSRVKVRIKADTYLPPLPYRGPDGRVFFPTGDFETTLTADDLALPGIEVLHVYDSLLFEPRDDMAAFAQDFFKLRKAGGFEGEVFKIVLNGLYGKFAERSEKQILLINPPYRDPETQVMLAPGIFVGTEEIHVRHEHVPISATITARSRRTLYEDMLAPALRDGPIYYTDTDAVICDADLPEGIALGELKKEYVIRQGRFIGSKLYAIEHEPDAKGKTEKIKAKGFSRRVSEGGEVTPLTYQDFLEVANGEQVKVQRMLRIRELLRREGADYMPKQIDMLKRINLKLRPKRERVGGGDSRPWSVEELTSKDAKKGH